MILFYALIALLLLVLICMGIELYQLLSWNAKCINKFPGPKCNIIIGNAKDIVVPTDVLFKNFRCFASAYYPLYKLWSSNVYGCINVIGPDDMQIILSNVKHNEKGPVYLVLDDWLGQGLLTSSGDKWQQRRKIITPTFHFKILKQFIGIFNKHSKHFVDDICTDEVTDIVPYIHKCSLHMIAEAAMGTSLRGTKGDSKYRKAIHDMGCFIMYKLTRPWLYTRITNMFTANYLPEKRTLSYLRTFTKDIIDKREKINSPVIVETDENIYLNKRHHMALLDLLLQAKKDKKISYEGIREEVDTFMFEGHDTISMAMSFCCMLIACNKHVQDLIYEEIMSVIDESKECDYEDLQNLNYMEMAIKEALRIYPSVPLISRIAGEDITTSIGFIIPKGAVLLLHIYDTHHNPDLYPDPERYDPERFSARNSMNRHPYAYLPFSAGSRNCIGQKYAILSMKSMLVALLRKFELHPIDTPETITLFVDIILRSQEGIKIKLKRRDKMM